MLKTRLGIKNYVTQAKIWITLQNGSLKRQGEAEDDANMTNWPTEDQVRNVVRNIHQRRTRTTQSPQRANEEQNTQPSMADSIQKEIDPFEERDPWQHAREAQNAQQHGTEGTHNWRGLSLVTEKNLNKVPYARLSKQVKDYIEAKGPEGTERVEAMLWAVSFGKQKDITDDMAEQ